MLCFFMLMPSACFHNSDSQLLLHKHPLAGKIWHVDSRRFISLEQMLSVLPDADYLLLGEIHDNIEHHRRQAQIIRHLYQSKRKVAVYFEMIDDEQGDILLAEPVNDMQKLLDLLDQKKHGWDYEGMYRVVFEAAMDSGFEILPANIARDRIIDLMQREESDLPEEISSVLARGSLSEEQYLAMKNEVVQAHCNSLPDSMMDPMIRAQRLRDAKMAMSMKHPGDHMRLLITGGGHARIDRGVPHYLRSLGVPGSDIISLVLVEVAEDMNKVHDYRELWDDHLPFNYIWFTPRFDRPDPCEGLEMHLKKKAEQ